LKARFGVLATELGANEAKIVEELNAAQGSAVDIGGYFKPDFDKATKAMRPSATFNAALDTVVQG
ncbi:MAG: NADP-dependent isocitrate dehydrogenase, partial [Proteobacteria bacterium]|nr:NADP-dependent isocitrate dehydrogenase [Pseudomonadota bacterium]